jgi:hypothetical protein
MVSSNSHYYEYGSTAKKVKLDDHRYNEVHKKNNKKSNKKVKYTMAKLRILFIMLIVFGCGMTMMYRYALITDINYKIDESKRQYTQIKNDNLNIKVKIENSLDLAKVREVAEGKYGMHKPQREQIVSVNVPKVDYIKTNEDVVGKDINNKNIVAAGLLKVARIVGLIK